jgi:hypothetical protein
MPKVEEFYHIYNKRLSATRRTRRASACAAGAPALRERNHNFRHFRSFGVIKTFNRFKTVPSGVKYFFEIGSNDFTFNH